MATAQWFRRIPNTYQIKHIFECRSCCETCPEGMRVADWQQLQVGLTPQGFQVWCLRHTCNVVHLDFNSQRVGANVTSARGVLWPATR